MSDRAPTQFEGSATVADLFPLTPMQRAMVLAAARVPHSGIYLLQTVCTMHHAVDPGLLRKAWRVVADRHEILRSTIHSDAGGGFRRQVHPDADIPWEELDWRGLPATEQEQQYHDLLNLDRRRGFSLDGTLPWRVILLQRSDCVFTLIWSAHHALLDGRSQFLVLQELFEAYESFCAGCEPRFDAPVAFRKHAEWLQGRDLTEAERYFRGFMAAETGESCLLSDRLLRHCDAEGEPHIRKSLRFSPEFTERLVAFARQHDLTLNTVVQGAWALLLSRHSGSPEVVFGATRACRRSSVAGADGIVGPLINTVPVAVYVPADMPLRLWLRELRKQWLDLRPYEHTPLDKIQEWAGASLAKPLFQSLLVYENQSLHDALQSLGGDWRHRNVSVMQRVDSPITLAGFGAPQLTLDLICARQHFCEYTVEQMLGHLRTLLENIPTQGDVPLRLAPFLSVPERQQIIYDWNRTEAEYPRDLCAHELFEQTAAASPSQPALLDGHRALTYCELNEISNQLARCLRAKGVGPEKLVGVCLERSPDLVMGIFAILKAGGVFLPLDPGLPPARLAHMMRESGASWVITRSTLMAIFEDCAAEKLCLDALEDEMARQPRTNLTRTATAHNAAYAIYTSGSTGEPKAVLVEHRSLVNHTLAGRALYRISTRDRRVQFALMGTDFFVAELFNYISSGATLVFQPADLSRSIRDFLQFLKEKEITVTAFPGSYWSQCVHALSEGGLSLPESLRLVITGMERIDPVHLAIWRKRVSPKVRWVNAYGPSETTCTATVYEAGTSEWEGGSFVPIGRPLANTTVYVLDRNQNPVPVGIEGEVYIGGDGVARGYLNRPDLTAERFIPDSFTGAGTGAMYRTGDLAFYLPDGNLVFTGRIDRQIKIRGFRVELDEIEAVLGRHPDVLQCAVTVCERGNSPFLAGYVTMKKSRPSDEDLRRRLASCLPDYMIPSAFVRLDSMPLTASGKIDRKALPAPSREIQSGTGGLRPPVSQVQRRLAFIWREILGMEAVDIADSFFDLGGDSLQAARLLTMIHKEFARNLAFSDLLAAPTIERLAWNLERAEIHGARGCLVALQESGARPAFFCVHGGDGEVMIFRDLARFMGKDQPFYGVKAVGIDGTEPPLESVEEMASRYVDEMLEVQPRGPFFIGGFCLGAFIAVEIASRLRDRNHNVGLVAVINTDAAWRDRGSLSAEMRRHGRRLIQLSYRRRLAYLRRRAAYRTFRIRSTMLEFAYQSMSRSGRIPPPRLRRRHAMEICHRAGQKYTPRAFPGRITCFHGAEESEVLPGDFWGRIALEGIDIERIPGEGMAVLRPPNVQFLAEKLRHLMSVAIKSRSVSYNREKDPL